MIVAIFHNANKKQATDIARSICEFLHKHSITVVAEDDEAASINAKRLSEVDEASIDFCISLGGDGTILRLIHRHPLIQTPILAINLGSLGFMADIPVNEIFSSLKNVLEGNYTVDSRLVIEGTTTANQSNFAVNEIVIYRSGNPRIIDLNIFVDGRYLNTFSADGVIISTPSGSTAYSLASGGPILTPELNAIVLTPISPHTISNRPIVLLPKNEIRVEYISSHANVEVVYDGFPYFTVASGESVSIVRSKRLFRLINMPGHDYFATLRSKLGWTGKLRGQNPTQAS